MNYIEIRGTNIYHTCASICSKNHRYNGRLDKLATLKGNDIDLLRPWVINTILYHAITIKMLEKSTLYAMIVSMTCRPLSLCFLIVAAANRL